MFCIKCGKPAVAGNFCKDCFLEKKKLFEAEEFTARVCTNCGKYIDGEIEEQIRRHLSTTNIINSCDIATKQSHNRITATIECTGKIPPLKSPVTEKRTIHILLKRAKCANCIKLLGGYHEAIFQVRGEKTERILNKLRKLVPGELIVDISKVRNGFDIKISDKKIAAIAVKELREYFEITESYKLVGEKNGKKLYRNSYAIR